MKLGWCPTGHNQPLLWTGPRRVDSLSLVWRLSARRVARHRTSSVMPLTLPGIRSLPTERLFLRPMVIDDTGVIAAMQMDPHVMANYGNGQPLNQADAEATVSVYHVRCREHDYWAWAVTLSASGEVLGQVTAGWDPLRGERAIALGYIFKQLAWGQGYGPEAVAAVLRHGLVDLGWPSVWAGVSPLNARSRRLCEKVGMVCVGEVLNPRGHLRMVYKAVPPGA
jgi:ribosomal-protein-alanine N-acetyltransferase